jgi:hypothetical protein
VLILEVQELHRLCVDRQLLVDREAKRDAAAVASRPPLDRVVRRRVDDVDLLPVERLELDRVAAVDRHMADHLHSSRT